MSIFLAVANFFQKYFVAKKLVRWRSIVIEKCTVEGYTNHVISRAGFTLCWAPGTLDFRNIFLPNIGEDQKSPK